MVERRNISGNPSLEGRGVTKGGDYFPDESKIKRFISCGCTLLDCVLGGGFVLGTVVNIVGDKSSGKTLMAIEACADFVKRYPEGRVYYRDAESVFDEEYAASLGIPVKNIDFGPKGTNSTWRTIEAVFKDLREKCKWHNDTQTPGLYIIDSLDALTSEAAMKRDVGEGSYKLDKQRILGEMFEDLISELRSGEICLLVISQVREKIGFVLGEKYRRSGGKALDFYTAHIIWLTHIKTLYKSINGYKRAIGIRVQANCKKNKVGLPFGKCVFTIRFEFGIDDVQSCALWLLEQKMGDRIGISVKKDKVVKRADKEDRDKYSGEIADLTESLDNMSTGEYKKTVRNIKSALITAWKEVNTKFKPKRRKYE